VTQGDVTMDVDRTGLKVEGMANIGPWRTNLKWEETFDEGLTPTRYHVYGDMDHSVLDGFGFGGREFFDGKIGVDIRATGQGLALEAGQLKADLKETEITLGDYWTKQTGVEAGLSAALKRDEQGTYIDNIDITAPDLKVIGDVSFTSNFALRDLSLSTLQISDFIEGQLTLKPDTSRELLSGSFSGKKLDISRLIDTSLSNQTSTFDVPIIFSGETPLF